MKEKIVTKDALRVCIEFYNEKKVFKKEDVRVQYADQESYYFLGQVPLDFNKPKKRAKVKIYVYTSNGVYKSETTFRDVSFAFDNVLYELNVPKKWDFVQLRIGMRKQAALPLKIKFQNDIEIDAETFDISIGGFSFIGKMEHSSNFIKFKNEVQIVFPPESSVDFPDKIMKVNSVFVRKKVLENDYEKGEQEMYCFKFLKLDAKTKMYLKKYLVMLY